MGQRGPAPKPTVIKERLGNPGKRPLNNAEPSFPVPCVTPYVPRWLNGEGKREWRRLVRMLIDTGLYTEVDHAALAMYCRAWGRWVDAEKKVNELGLVRESETGYEYASVWRQEANKAFDQLNRMIQQFGFSPSARTRIKIQPREDDDLLSALFGGETSVTKKRG